MRPVELHGYDHIPEQERGMTAPQAAYLWVATNANLFFVSVGVIALGVGLAVWQALVAVVLGTLLFAVVALGSIGGARAGLPTMTFTRAAFGTRGNMPHALLAWAASVAFEAINAIFAVYALIALAGFLGWEDPGRITEALAAILVTVAAAAIAVYGHRTIVVAQRLFAVALTVTLSGVLAYTIGSVEWTDRGASELSGGAAVAGVLAAAAVVASGPISYLYNAPDWVRYLPSRTAGRTIFWTVFASSASVALFLSVMGVLLASQADMTDPIAGVEPLVPDAVYVVYVLSAIGGSIANSVVTYYSSGLCLQAAGLPLRRHTATALDAVVSTALVLAVLLVADFTEVLEDSWRCSWSGSPRSPRCGSPTGCCGAGATTRRPSTTSRRAAATGAGTASASARGSPWRPARPRRS